MSVSYYLLLVNNLMTVVQQKIERWVRTISNSAKRTKKGRTYTAHTRILNKNSLTKMLILCNLINRAGNSLIGFPSESLVFCPKMSE